MFDMERKRNKPLVQGIPKPSYFRPFTYDNEDILEEFPGELKNTLELQNYIISNGSNSKAAFAITCMLIQDIAKNQTRTPEGKGRTSHFSYLIAPTGSGKQKLPDTYSRLNIPAYGGWSSESGMMQELKTHNSMTFISQEADIIHQKIHKNEHGFLAIYLNAYTTGEDTKLHSAIKVGEEQFTVTDPAISLLMTCTPESCHIFNLPSYAAMGGLNRNTLWFMDQVKKRGEAKTPKKLPIPPRVNEQYLIPVMPWTQEAEWCYRNTIGDLEQVNSDVELTAISLEDPELVARFREQALRLATAIAWYEKSEITKDILVWCYNIIKFTNLSTLEKITKHQNKSGLESLQNKHYSMTKLGKLKTFNNQSTQDILLHLSRLCVEQKITLRNTKTGEVFRGLPTNADGSIKGGGPWSKDIIIEVNPLSVVKPKLQTIKLLQLHSDKLKMKPLSVTSVPKAQSLSFTQAVTRDEALVELDNIHAVQDFKENNLWLT